MGVRAQGLVYTRMRTRDSPEPPPSCPPPFSTPFLFHFLFTCNTCSPNFLGSSWELEKWPTSLPLRALWKSPCQVPIINSKDSQLLVVNQETYQGLLASQTCWSFSAHFFFKNGSQMCIFNFSEWPKVNFQLGILKGNTIHSNTATIIGDLPQVFPGSSFTQHFCDRLLCIRAIPFTRYFLNDLYLLTSFTQMYLKRKLHNHQKWKPTITCPT